MKWRPFFLTRCADKKLTVYIHFLLVMKNSTDSIVGEIILCTQISITRDDNGNHINALRGEFLKCLAIDPTFSHA